MGRPPSPPPRWPARLLERLRPGRVSYLYLFPAAGD